jgi:hypothetical protein
MTPEAEIRRIQTDYIKVLESHLARLWQDYKESYLSPINFLRQYNSLHSSSGIEVSHAGRRWTSLSFQVNELLNDVLSFWSHNRPSLEDALSRCDKLNTQVGDLNGRSHYYLNATLRLGLYFDSICLLDPLAIAAQRRETIDQFLTGANDDPELIQILLCFLEMHSLKSFILAETDLPIVIVMPPGGLVWGDDKFKSIEEVSKFNTLKLFADALEEPIQTIGDLLEYAKGGSLEALESKFKRHEVLKDIFDEVGFNSLTELIDFSRVSTTPTTELRSEIAKLPILAKGIAHIFGSIQGLMLAIEGAEASATEIHIDINIPKSLWGFYRYRAKSEAELFAKRGLRVEIPIQTAIMSEAMNWMSATTVDALVRMREQGVMEEVRNIYRIKRRELQRASLNNFESAARAVVETVTEALQETMKEVQVLRRATTRSLVIQSSKFIVSGGLGVAAFFFPVLSVLSFIYSTTLPGASISDIANDYSKNREMKQELANRPIVHMLEIWERSQSSDGT